MDYHHVYQYNRLSREHDITHDGECWCNPTIEVYAQGQTLVTHRKVEDGGVYELSGRKLN